MYVHVRCFRKLYSMQIVLSNEYWIDMKWVVMYSVCMCNSDFNKGRCVKHKTECNHFLILVTWKQYKGNKCNVLQYMLILILMPTICFKQVGTVATKKPGEKTPVWNKGWPINWSGWLICADRTFSKPLLLLELGSYSEQWLRKCRSWEVYRCFAWMSR